LKQNILSLNINRCVLIIKGSSALDNDYTFWAILEVVSERAFLVLDEVTFDEESACVKLAEVGRKQEHQRQENIKDHA